MNFNCYVEFALYEKGFCFSLSFFFFFLYRTLLYIEYRYGEQFP